MHRLFIALTVVAIMVAAAMFGFAQPDKAAKSEFPADYYFGSRSAGLIGMEGKAAPALNVDNWIGKQQSLAELKGKVVVVDFWGTWCPPCMRSLPHNVDLVKKHEKDGLMFIGVHESNRGTEKMAAVAKSQKINYPLCVDKSNSTGKSYNVSFYPTYVVIDRKGIIRAAGLLPDAVDKVVAKLLKEKSADDTPSKESSTKTPE